MSDFFNLSPLLQDYFNALPRDVQYHIAQSGAKISSVEDLKSAVNQYTEVHNESHTAKK